MDINAYMDRIVVRSGYFTIYFQGTPQGSGSLSGIANFNYRQTGDWLIQDLDRPSRTFTGIRGEHGQFMTFQNVNCRRFSLTIRGDQNTIWENINLDDAEYEP